MASPAVPSVASGNSSSWAPSSGPVRPGWGRGNVEPGAAFRGTSRGRPGGRGARGGRGGRGGGARGGVGHAEESGTKPAPQQVKDKTTSDTSKATVPSTAAPSSAPAPPSAAATKTNGRAKGPSKKSSESKPIRKASTASSVSTLAPASSEPSPISTRPIARRRRSHTNTKAAPTVLPTKQSLSAEPSLNPVRPQKAVSAPKDLPPHLAPPPTFDIKHDIDALVERVRAVAMDRPYTPGSHIDWAGDDDDSLPDLNDWGVTSTTTTDQTSDSKASIISPILEDALKPLPNLDSTPVIVTPDVDHTALKLMDDDAVVVGKGLLDDKAPHTDATIHNGKNRTRRGSRGKDALIQTHPDDESKARKGDTNEQVFSVTSFSEPIAPSSQERQSNATGDPSLKAAAKPPLHPSLPPKPVAALDGAVANHHPRNGTSEPYHGRPKPISLAPPTDSGLARSIHAPPNTAVSPMTATSTTTVTTSEDSSIKETSPERGLEASMHAPLPPSMSAPSHITIHPHSGPPSFNPVHNRSRTVGRVPGLRTDHLADPDRLARGDAAHHARTRSTPPTGSGPSAVHARTMHATRPVITGDAISRLARTLGSAGLPIKREAVAVSASKD